MQQLLLARYHLGVIIYPNLGVIWTRVCVMHMTTVVLRCLQVNSGSIPQIRVSIVTAMQRRQP